jgi:hypothetical protein
MLLCMEELLEAGEVITGVSLAAGNTGREFDLVTDRRIAEFTFIDWKGGAESIRKQKIFKDFYLLADAATDKRRELYFLGARHAHKVFSSKSSCAGMLRKFAFLREKFIQQYGSKMTVREYYELHRTQVLLCNIEITAPRTARHFAMPPLRLLA